MKREDAAKAFERISAASVEIGSVVEIFRGRVDEQTFCQIALGCGRVLASMYDELLKQIYARHPELEAESKRRAQEALIAPENRSDDGR